MKKERTELEKADHHQVFAAKMVGIINSGTQEQFNKAQAKSEAVFDRLYKARQGNISETKEKETTA